MFYRIYVLSLIFQVKSGGYVAALRVHLRLSLDFVWLRECRCCHVVAKMTRYQ